MKKIISLVLAIVLLLGVGIWETTAVGAAGATENLCRLFDDELSYLSIRNTPYRANWVFERVYEHIYADSGAESPQDFIVSKAEYSALANRLFQLDKSVEELIAEYPDSEVFISVDGRQLYCPSTPRKRWRHSDTRQGLYRKRRDIHGIFSVDDRSFRLY